MIDIGVASPSAQGQAMISTATAFTSAWVSRGGGPKVAHTTKVAAAASTTAGTKKPETRSANRWMGARLRCASPTMRTICASKVSAPTRSARITRLPVPFTVPAFTRPPAIFSTGRGSPVIIDSSTKLVPSSTTPSTGTFSPGRTRRRSPGTTRSSGRSFSSPLSGITRAVLGARPSRARMAVDVRLRARSSSTWPSSTRVVITAAASK